jgi:hypothetical protein
MWNYLRNYFFPFIMGILVIFMTVLLIYGLYYSESKQERIEGYWICWKYGFGPWECEFSIQEPILKEGCVLSKYKTICGNVIIEKGIGVIKTK